MNNVCDREFSPHVGGADAAVSSWGLGWLQLNPPMLVPGPRQVLHPRPLGWQLTRRMLWNSFYEQDVKGHDDAGDCHSSVQPGSDHSSFVKHTPDSLLL